MAVAVLLSGALLPSSASAAAASAVLQITSSPGLFPAFDPAISDYVVRCGETPVLVSVTAPTGYTVAVGGEVAATGMFVVPVSAKAGEAFSINVSAPGGTVSTAHVRCLPSDFPTWSPMVRDPGTSPQAQFYVVTPFDVHEKGRYLTLFDAAGVPVWWIDTTTALGAAAFGTVLPNGDVAWTSANNTVAEEHNLDGAKVRTIQPSTPIVDEHELILLPDGDYLIGGQTDRTGVDLSSWGGVASALTNVTIVDDVLQEVTPSGAVVWSWDAYDHIPVSEVDPQWRATILAGAPYDVYHWNSMDPTAGGVIASFRYLDAVYDITQADGHIVWKLGGTSRPDGTSLTVAGDPVFAAGSGFGGQHDARILPDGTVTVFDDQTGRPGPPRAVRYALTDTTAALVESVVDPATSATMCCGSARKLAGGDWVISSGLSGIVTELTTTGQRAWGLDLAPGAFSYRVMPVAAGTFTVEQLRQGMDVQATGSATTGAPITVAQLTGADAIDTAVSISRHDWADAGAATSATSAASPKPASTVVLADPSIDALIGAPVAAAKAGPLLLNGDGGLDPRNLAEIERVLPAGGAVLIVGGGAAVAPSAESDLAAAGYSVTRFAGADRYATAVAVAEGPLGHPSKVVEASGTGMADALIGGPVASHLGGALLLTAGAQQAGPTADYLATNPSVARYAIGGAASAADTAAQAVVGADRYGTATMVASTFFGPAPTAVGVGGGDALTAGASMGSAGGPLLLAPVSGPVSRDSDAYLAADAALRGVTEYGGAPGENPVE
ncbi:MAG: hypothetical protein NVS3B12_25370 [Acidimicrobiales bacterium]